MGQSVPVNRGFGATSLFPLDQGNPVFIGVLRRVADGGLAGAGYLGFGACLQGAAGARVVPLYREGCLIVAQIEVRCASGG